MRILPGGGGTLLGGGGGGLLRLGGGGGWTLAGGGAPRGPGARLAGGGGGPGARLAGGPRRLFSGAEPIHKDNIIMVYLTSNKNNKNYQFKLNSFKTLNLCKY